MSTTTRGRIVKILDGTPTRWVVNLGAEHISTGDELVVFEVGEEIVDPTDGTSLGELELVKCHAIADHVQDKLSVVSRKGAAPVATASRVLSAVLADTGPAGKDGGRPNSATVRVGDSVRKVT
jgi:hypothetical protein